MCRPWVGICLVVVVVVVAGACSDSEMSLTDYVELYNAIAEEADEQGALMDQAPQIGDSTPRDLQTYLEQELSLICVPLQASIDAIEPPEQIVDLHNRMWEWHAGFISVREALAARAGESGHTDADWAALSESPEMAAYRASVVEGKQVCADLQAGLDATAQRGIFAETPWIPGELKEIAEVVLGCEGFPEHPEDLYRFPPPTPGS